jgi:hypothetical protein
MCMSAAREDETMAYTTIDTLTDKQIDNLAEAAGAANDRAMVAICRIARGEIFEDVGADMDLTPEEAQIVSKCEHRDTAREECVRVIVEGEIEAYCPDHGCPRFRCDEAHEASS